MVKVLLISDSVRKHEDRIREMLDDHASTYRIDYELIVKDKDSCAGTECDMAISLVKFFTLDGVRTFDGIPIATDSLGEKIEKDILNQMLKIKVKQKTGS